MSREGGDRRLHILRLKRVFVARFCVEQAPSLNKGE